MMKKDLVESIWSRSPKKNPEQRCWLTTSDVVGFLVAIGIDCGYFICLAFDSDDHRQKSGGWTYPACLFKNQQRPLVPWWWFLERTFVMSIVWLYLGRFLWAEGSHSPPPVAATHQDIHPFIPASKVLWIISRTNQTPHPPPMIMVVPQFTQTITNPQTVSGCCAMQHFEIFDIDFTIEHILSIRMVYRSNGLRLGNFFSSSPSVKSSQSTWRLSPVVGLVHQSQKFTNKHLPLAMMSQ
jgi:hypothetical protein